MHEDEEHGILQEALEPLDKRRFMSKSKQQRYAELESRSLICEWKVDLKVGHYEEFQATITKKKMENSRIAWNEIQWRKS